MKEKGRGEVKRCRLLGRGRKRPADRRAGSDKVQHGLASGAQGSRCEGGARARQVALADASRLAHGSERWQHHQWDILPAGVAAVRGPRRASSSRGCQFLVTNESNRCISAWRPTLVEAGGTAVWGQAEGGANLDRVAALWNAQSLVAVTEVTVVLSRTSSAGGGRLACLLYFLPVVARIAIVAILVHCLLLALLLLIVLVCISIRFCNPVNFAVLGVKALLTTFVICFPYPGSLLYFTTVVVIFLSSCLCTALIPESVAISNRCWALAFAVSLLVCVSPFPLLYLALLLFCTFPFPCIWRQSPWAVQGIMHTAHGFSCC